MSNRRKSSNNVLRRKCFILNKTHERRTKRPKSYFRAHVNFGVTNVALAKFDSATLSSEQRAVKENIIKVKKKYYITYGIK